MSKSPKKTRGFYGDQKDREAFMALVNSAPRSPDRSAALAAWSDYKKSRGKAFVLKENRERTNKRNKSIVTTKGASAKKKRRPQRGKLFKKSDYIHSLTARAVHLEGIRLNDVVLGFADLRGVCFDDAEFNSSKQTWYALKGSRFECASLRRALLKGARLMEADFRKADLGCARLDGADLTGANLADADLAGASLRNANLERASLMRANLTGCDMTGARVYGASLWDVKVCDDESLRTGLIVTPKGEPPLIVDNLDVAQFAYTLLSGSRIGPALDTLASKGVLLLGRFSGKRKKLLEALRTELRSRDYIPIIFDFQRPKALDLTETVRLLVGMSSFVIVDLTGPRSVPLELQATIPVHMVPFVPLIQKGEKTFAMFQDLWSKHGGWVLDPLEYRDRQELLDNLDDAIIGPAEAKRAELLAFKERKLTVRKAKNFR